MEEIKLNQTPVRTSRNFNINNIKLKNIAIPNEIEEFKNIDIKGKINLGQNKIDLKYGVGITNKPNVKLNIDVNKKEKYPYEIEFRLDKENMNLVENIEINAAENSEATVIIKYKAENSVKGFHNGVIKVNANKKSKIDVILVNLVNEQTNNFISMQNELEEESKLNYTIVDFGGKNNVTNYYSNIKGNKADNKINTIYLAKNEQLFDLNYIGELYGLESNIDIDVQGAIKDEAKKHFKGTIDFKRGCKKATGNENEFCTILSDKAKAIALPMLLCEEEEVEGNHSTSAGKIEEKELFYIMSRGFEQKDAMKLIIRAKFNKVLENIKDENLKEEILQEIDTRLS